jgi:hypothetical protein
MMPRTDRRVLSALYRAIVAGYCVAILVGMTVFCLIAVVVGNEVARRMRGNIRVPA